MWREAEVEDYERSRRSDGLSGYNPNNKNGCFIQFATWRRDYI